MNAEEFLKGLNEHDPVFEIDTEYEYTEEQLINFAERYHERKLKILRLQNVSQQRELLAFEEWCKVNVKVREYKEAISDILERYRKANCG